MAFISAIQAVQIQQGKSGRNIKRVKKFAGIAEQKIINKEGGHSKEKTAVFYIAALLVFIPLVMAIVIMQPYKPTYLTYNAVLVLLPAYFVLLLCV